MELGVESSFPVSEETSSGYLMAGSQAIALILVFLTNGLRNSADDNLPQESTLVIFVGMAIASILVFFYKNSKNRQNLN